MQQHHFFGVRGVLFTGVGNSVLAPVLQVLPALQVLLPVQGMLPASQVSGFAGAPASHALPVE